MNGAGKTTTIGKLASRFITDDLSVLVAAGDTFRAAAEDQLAIWCERAGAELIRGGENAEPASVVFDAMHAASIGTRMCSLWIPPGDCIPKSR